jgi:hypothetical protein
MPPRRFDYEEAFELWQSGWSYEWISRRLGVTSATVRRACKVMLNPPEEKPKRKPKPLPPLTPRKGVTPGRLASAARVRALYDQGWLMKDISAELGICPSWTSALLNDPDGSRDRARKDRYRQPCEVCGTLTGGGEGRKEHPRCRLCAQRLAVRTPKWPKELLVARIQEWNDLYGEPPASTDWNPHWLETGGNDPDRARRWRDGHPHWPWFTVVHREFGGWNPAIEAAGFQPRPAHGGGGNARRTRRYRETQKA